MKLLRFDSLNGRDLQRVHTLKRKLCDVQQKFKMAGSVN